MPIRHPWRESTRLLAEFDSSCLREDFAALARAESTKKARRPTWNEVRQRATEVFSSSGGLSFAVHFCSHRWQNVRIVAVEPGWGCALHNDTHARGLSPRAHARTAR